jgi:hypothetical protein
MWLAVGRRPLGRRLPSPERPSAAVCPRRRIRYSLFLLYRHTYLQTKLRIVLYLFFSARVMVGLASPHLEAGAWLAVAWAVGRRPLGRRLPPPESPSAAVCPRRRITSRYTYTLVESTVYLTCRELAHSARAVPARGIL